MAVVLLLELHFDKSCFWARTMATFTPDFGEEYYVIFEDPESLTVQSISVTVKPIIRPVQVTFEEAGLPVGTE